MIIINTDQHNGTQTGVNIFYAAPILSGKYAGKYATSENALNEFPAIFETEPYEVVELDPKDFQIDYTPPTLSNIGVIIPEKFEWVFANDRFEINGFVVDFARVNGQLAVDVAYITWEAFQQELDLPTNATVKASLMPIWRHVETEFELGNIIKL